MAWLEAALAVAESEREAFVRQKCRDDPEVAGYVLKLLRTDPGVSGLSTGGAAGIEQALAMPAVIDMYRIDRELGRGGMGAVYLAHRQADDFSHTVAIKVVNPAGIGEANVQRLAAERSTLARLKHPNIAQLYDGGQLPDGAPYLVMEYFDGAQLGSVLANRQLGFADRVSLFSQVCAGVSHAHRNLVIHRDLSPANILVNEALQVKIIDFGIAHDLQAGDLLQAPTGAPLFTMTPGFAAPERMDGAVSSTATDVYSLGKILERLMAGAKPPREKDLIAIIRKATATQPDHRYASADALMDDVVAWFEVRPVRAVTPSYPYRLARFFQRWRWQVGAGITALALVLVASTASVVLYLRAEASSDEAEERFEEVRSLANYLIFGLHDELDRLEGSAVAREHVLARGIEYLDRLSALGPVPVDLRSELALGYQRLSDVRGNPARANLGEREAAFDLQRRAVDMASQLINERRDARSLRTYAEILHNSAVQQIFSRNDLDAAVAELLQVKSVYAELAATEPPAFDDRLASAHVEMMLGYSLRILARYGEAVEFVERALDAYRQLAREQPTSFDARFGLARAEVTAAEVHSWSTYVSAQPDYAPALALFDAGVARWRAMAGDTPSDSRVRDELVIALLKRANTTCYLPPPHPEAGLADLVEALTLGMAWQAANPRDQRAAQHNTHNLVQQTACLISLGRADDALRVAQQAIAARRAALASQPDNPNVNTDLANTLWSISSVLIEAGLDAEACSMADEVVSLYARFEENGWPMHPFNQDELTSSSEYVADCGSRGLL
ncbi:MAG: serine/threonine protein kinase [Pseudomonadales bacterium]|nr:serine/threonine protein kinase [Pseudomonadales bacterium]